MKKTLFIFILLILSLIYYLGFFSKKEISPLSSEFLFIESPTSTDRFLDLKAVDFLKSKKLHQSPSLSKKELDKLLQMKLDKGIRNLSTISHMLLRDAKKMNKSGEKNRALELIDYAILFSPDLSQPYFDRALILWQKSPFYIHRLIREFLNGLMIKLSFFPSSLQFLYNFFYIISNAILMAFLVFGITILAKYLPLYFYNIRKNLTDDPLNLLINGLKIFVLLIPLFLKLDILWALLFWSILLWGYVSPRKRTFIVIFLIILTYLPFFLHSSSSFLNSRNVEIMFEINEANYGNWDRGTEERLRTWLFNHPDDEEVLLTLGLIEKRKGNYVQSEEFYRRALQNNPYRSEGFSNLGNVYLAQKKIAEAINSYQQAIELNSEKGSYYYNLYRAYTQENLFSIKIDKAFQMARKFSPKLVDYYMGIDSLNPNRMVIDEIITTNILWGRFFDQLIGKEGLLFHLFKAWFERIPSRIPFLAPIVGLAFLIGISRYSRYKRFLTKCPMCGIPTYRFYLGTAGKEFVCFNCYRIFVNKEKLLHPKVVEKKSFQAQEFQKKDHFTGRSLSFIFVGFNDLWRDEPLKGLLLLSILFAFVLRFIYWEGVIPSSYSLSSSSVSWRIIIWVGPFILFYLLFLRRSLRQRPKFMIRK